MKKKNLKNVIMQISGLVILFSTWEFVTRFFNVPTFIFPRLSEIVEEFSYNPYYFLNGFFTTYGESVLGLLAGGFLAYILALLFSLSVTIKQVFYQWFVLLKTVPSIAISPLIILWLGSGLASKVLMASIITFFPILVNTLNGLYSITDNQIQLFKSMNATKAQMFFRLRLPMSIGYLFAGLKIAAPLSAIGALVSEFSGSTRGLGYIILRASWETNTKALMTGVILASILGMTLYKIIELIEYLVSKFTPYLNTKG